MELIFFGSLHGVFKGRIYRFKVACCKRSDILLGAFFLLTSHALDDVLEVALAGGRVLVGLALHDVVDAAEAEAARAHAGALAALGKEGRRIQSDEGC